MPQEFVIKSMTAKMVPMNIIAVAWTIIKKSTNILNVMELLIAMILVMKRIAVSRCKSLH